MMAKGLPNCISIHTISRCICLLVGAMAFGAPSVSAAFAYLDDAYQRDTAPLPPEGGYPKVMLTETKSLDGTDEQFGKYDVLGAKPGQYWKVARIQALHPQQRFHTGFSPRAYQGFNLANPCNLSQGLTFSRSGPATENCEIFSGHFLYYAGTRLTDGVSANGLELHVEDATRLDPGQFVVIYDAPAGSFLNAEHARVDAVDTGIFPHRVTLSVRGFKSTPKPRQAGSIIAQHDIGRSNQNPLNWAFNHSLQAPLDANGKTIGQAMVHFLQDNFGKNGNGRDTGVRIDGIYFDADPHIMSIKAGRLDGDNDLIADRLISDDGMNLWGEGLKRFYALMRDAFPDLSIVGGTRGSRGFESLNGIQMEGWPVAGAFGADIPVYGHEGENDGVDSMLQRYLMHLQLHQTRESHTENLSKTPSELYPDGFAGADGNASFRFGLGTTLLGNGFYGQQNSDRHPDPWYDEYAVDVNHGSPTYGAAIPSNPNDESAVIANKGWLGLPLGPHRRLYDAATFSPERSLFENGSFENGTTGWSFDNLSVSIALGDSIESDRSLRINGHSPYQVFIEAAVVSAPEVPVVAGREYTFAFAAKSEVTRELTVAVGSERNTYLVADDWTRIVHTFVAPDTGAIRPQIYFGNEDVTTWLDAAYFFDGNANVFLREFENGMVVVNATPRQRTIDLGQPLLRILGTGQDPINDGSETEVVEIAAYDAAILVRPDSPGPVDSCGTPGILRDDVPRFYIWEDLCNPGHWSALVSQDGPLNTVIGRLTSNEGTFGTIAPDRLEPADVLSVNADATTIDFELTVSRGFDGFLFQAPDDANLCLTLEEPGELRVFRGDRPYVSAFSFDPRTGGHCVVPPASPESCGDSSHVLDPTPRLYLWEDSCDPGTWHVRVTQQNQQQRFSGSLTASQGSFSGLTTSRVEPSDSIQVDDSSTQIDFDLLLGTGLDEFSFTLQGDPEAVCVALTVPTDTVVTVNDTPVDPGQVFALGTGQPCNPPPVCDGPTVVRDAEPRFYIWEDPCNPGAWSVRATHEGSRVVFEGTMRSEGGMLSEIQRYRLEANDEVVLLDGSSATSFRLIVGTGVDGFSVNATPGSSFCLDLTEPTDAVVLLGTGAIPVAAAVDLTSGEACGF